LSKRLSLRSSGGRQLIVGAALLHLSLAVGLFCAGRAQLAPRLIDRDGIIESFAFDSIGYHQAAIRLAEILKEGRLKAWATEPEQAHVKLISLQFAILGPLFGNSTLSAEPLNGLCYVSILSLVMLLGRELGGRRVGLLAAGIVALWPTLLLHTTQLLKDPLFIAGALAFLLIVTTWLTRSYSWVQALTMGALVAVTTGLLLLIRQKFAVVIFAVAFLGFALLIVRQLVERRLLYWNLICPLLILIAGTFAHFYLTAGNGNKETFKLYPSVQSGQYKSVVSPRRQEAVIFYKPSASPKKAPQTYLERSYAATEKAVLEVSAERHKFNIAYPESGSAIDRNIEFKSVKELILYLPRAFEIGFFAPFPQSWISSGQRVGSAGRLLSGAETFIIYLCELLALYGLWRNMRCLAAWLLLLVTTFGVTVLGLIVSNVGTLYRFRYPFWILLIVLGVMGFESLRGRRGLASAAA
jgi:4-amino-4-deoxy-L-arabinose transferase-like glycosyltransferase